MKFRQEIIGDATPRGTWIYALTQGADGPVRYIGKTGRHLYQRHKQHLYEARRGRRPVCVWLRGLGQLPNTLENAYTIRAVEYVAPGGDWAARERYWIAAFRARGAALLNQTDGGEGLAGHTHTPEACEKIAAGLRTGQHFECQMCGSQFWRKRFAIERGENKFCSRACYQGSLRGVSRPLPAVAVQRGVAAAAAAKKARSHCLHGHPYSPDNTRLNKRGARICRACERAAGARHQERRNAEV